MNSKGQALIEFILILPLFIFLIFAVIDFGTITNSKNKLEAASIDIVTLFRNGSTIDEIRDLYQDYDITIGNSDGYFELKISTDVRMITPGTSKIFGDQYEIEVKRYIPNA